eukprot:TRINITY_DN9071_c0_g1_i8.p1 TRINITY_DN9071_c0_g1~~TRINITY_DN9071_c0_g1_i8.p1  ORF type:complete len:562 (-),score=52.55 TRINITY_DN9071_c0_g1_i8:29-1714(-)
MRFINSVLKPIFAHLQEERLIECCVKFQQSRFKFWKHGELTNSISRLYRTTSSFNNCDFQDISNLSKKDQQFNYAYSQHARFSTTVKPSQYAENESDSFNDEDPSKPARKKRRRQRLLPVASSLLLQLKQIGRPEQLYGLISKNGHDLDVKGLTAAFHRVWFIVATQRQREAILGKLVELFAAKITEFDARGLSEVALSCGKCGYRIDADLVAYMTKAIARNFEETMVRKKDIEQRCLSSFLLGLKSQPFDEQLVIDKIVPVFEYAMNTLDDMNFSQCLVSLQSMHVLYKSQNFVKVLESVKKRCKDMEATWLTGALHALVVTEAHDITQYPQSTEILDMVIERFVGTNDNTQAYQQQQSLDQPLQQVHSPGVRIVGYMQPQSLSRQQQFILSTGSKPTLTADVNKNLFLKAQRNRVSGQDACSFLTTFWFVKHANDRFLQFLAQQIQQNIKIISSNKLCLAVSQFADFLFLDEELFDQILVQVQLDYHFSHMLQDSERPNKVIFPSLVQLVYGLAKSGYTYEVNDELDENQLEDEGVQNSDINNEFIKVMFCVILMVLVQ